MRRSMPTTLRTAHPRWLLDALAHDWPGDVADRPGRQHRSAVVAARESPPHQP
jgi:hypothetical protein